jgi:predicted nucleotidyltransferase
LKPSRLGAFQREVLEAFFRKEKRFFLTGGAALAGFHLGHRETDDLDLFVIEDVLEDGVGALAAVVRELGATSEEILTTPDFRRRLLRRGGESVIVDLVRERVAQVFPDKLLIAGIRVDPAEEIMANKLCTLLARAEVRDLVDLQALEEAGLALQDALDAGIRKDRGLTPAQLAWVLSEIQIGDDARLPGGVAVPELREYLRELVERLSRMALPRYQG